MRALAVCLALLGGALLGSATPVLAQDDRGFVQGLLEDALSDDGRSVRIEGFAGALSSRATIDRISISDADGVWLSLEDVALVWSRRALLSGRIDIDEISAARIDLPRAPLPAEPGLPSAQAAGQFALPELPVSVRLGALQLAEVSIGPAILGEAVVLAVTGAADLENGQGRADLSVTRQDKGGSLRMAGAFDNGSRRLTLDLDLSEPSGGIAATVLGLPGDPSVALLVQGDDPLSDFNANILLSSNGEERLGGQARLRDAADGAQVLDLDVSGDLAPLLAPQYRAFLGPQIALKTTGQRLSNGTLLLDQLDLRADALRLTGSAQINPDGWPQAFALSGQIAAQDGAPVLLPLPGTPTRLTNAVLAAQFDAETGDAWQLETVITAFDRPDLQIDMLALKGEGRIARAAQRVEGALDLNVTDLSPADAALGAALGKDLTGALRFDWAPDAPLRLGGLDIAGADYGLRGAVAFDGLSNGLNIRVRPDLALRADRLRRFAPLAGVALQGAASLDIDGLVEPLSGVVDLTFSGQTQDLETGIAQLDGVLRGTGQLDLAVMRDESGTRVAPLRISTQAARIEADGLLAGDQSRFDLTADLTDVSDVLPSLRGAASLVATARQDGAVWTTRLTAKAPGDATLGYTGTVTGDFENTLALDGRLQADIGSLGRYAALIGQPLSGGLSLRASGTGDAIEGRFDMQADASATAFRTGIATLDTLLRGRAEARAQVAGRDGTLTITGLRLDAAGVNASASGTVSARDSALRFDAALPNLALLIPDLPGAARASGTARSSGGDWRVDIDGAGPGGITLTTNGTIAADGGRADLALRGTAPLALANAQIKPRALDGQVRFDLALTGPPALSSLRGTVSTDDARVSLPDLRNALTGVSLRARLGNSRAALEATGALNTGGQFAISGPVALTAPFGADLTAALSNITLKEPGLYETIANGRVTLRGPLTGGAQIGGQVSLESVEARIPSFGPSYQVLEGLRHVQPPADVLRTLQFAGLGTTPGSTGTTAATPAFPLDLTIAAPNRIFVRGRGLDAELGGALRLTGTTDAVVPQGQFDLIRGRLDLLGRRLTLTTGSIALRGSFDPVIRLAAETDVDGTAITIAIEGPVTDPDLTLASSPQLPEDEVLSLLLFGRSVASISPLQAVQLAQALRTLSGRGGGGISEQIRSGLGVDDFDISTDAAGTAQARVGAYISENIYTDVTVTADGDSEINLNLDISPNLTLRGRVGSDGDSGIGLFFGKDY